MGLTFSFFSIYLFFLSFFLSFFLFPGRVRGASAGAPGPRQGLDGDARERGCADHAEDVLGVVPAAAVREGALEGQEEVPRGRAGHRAVVRAQARCALPRPQHAAVPSHLDRQVLLQKARQVRGNSSRSSGEIEPTPSDLTLLTHGLLCMFFCRTTCHQGDGKDLLPAGLLNGGIRPPPAHAPPLLSKYRVVTAVCGVFRV